MKNTNNAIKSNANDIVTEVDQPVNDVRPERIYEEFPHLSRLEKFVLSTLDQEFNQNHTANATRQYVEYLSQKDKWERRQLGQMDAKGSPITFYRRDREPD